MTPDAENIPNTDTDPGASPGFTLLEVVLVMLVIALGVGIVLPRMPDLAGSRIDRGSRRVGMMIQVARDRAITLRRYYRLDVDLDNSSLTALYLGPENRYIEDEEVRTLTLPDGVYISDLATSGSGKVVSDRGAIHVSPKGVIEPSVIHVSDKRDRVVTVLPEFLSGHIRIVEGYRELSER